MKNVATSAAVILAASSSLTGCRAIEGIFKAGVWSGVILLAIIVAIVGGVISLLRPR
jgi:hypothetical protein